MFLVDHAIEDELLSQTEHVWCYSLELRHVWDFCGIKST